jgi:hypothetical protein
MPPRIPRKDAGGFAAGKSARAIAEQTPPNVLAGMLAGPKEVAGVTVYPLSLDILWTLQACAHPLATPQAGALDNLEHLQLAQLVFAFCSPEAALDAAAEGKDASTALSTFDRAALSFMRHHVPLANLVSVLQVVGAMVSEGLATAPGAGSGNPPPTSPKV